MTTLQIIEQKLEMIESISTLPMVLRQIQKVLSNPTNSIDQIAVVAKDQALASRSIRVVNSAYYGMGKRVTSFSHAIVILGLNTLNSLMIGLTVVKVFKNMSIKAFDPEKFWVHCFATAIIAKALAEHFGRKEPEKYFVTGLLHDMGRLVLDQFLHANFARAILFAHTNNKPLLRTESKTIGFNHAEVGEWLSRNASLTKRIYTFSLARVQRKDK
jgi:HD-like signal output (HDOD) protein